MPHLFHCLTSGIQRCEQKKAKELDPLPISHRAWWPQRTGARFRVVVGSSGNMVMRKKMSSYFQDDVLAKGTLFQLNWCRFEVQKKRAGVELCQVAWESARPVRKPKMQAAH